jgi:hypothetical protein
MTSKITLATIKELLWDLFSVLSVPTCCNQYKSREFNEQKEPPGDSSVEKGRRLV